MREAGVGRVLVASLHQAIADVLPTRLGFYEHWLHVDGLHAGTIGVGAVQAVLSFLRQEGEAYETISARAGEYAAEWTVDAMTTFERSFIAAMPDAVRRWLLLRVVARLVRATCADSQAVATLRRGRARIVVRASIFCSVREPVEHPLCLFYAAAFTRLLRRCGVRTRAEVVTCRGTGEPSCVVEIPMVRADYEGNAEAA